MGKKITTKTFIEKSKALYGDKYDYTSTYYRGYREVLAINCKEHGKFWQLPFEHLEKEEEEGCRQCNLNTFLFESQKIHGDLYDYSKSKYYNKHSRIEIICKKHGSFWKTAWEHSVAGHICPICSKNNYIELCETTIPSFDAFKEKINHLHGDTYDYSQMNYTNSYTRINIICKKHGLFTQAPISHYNGHGCQKCGIERTTIKCRIKHEKIFHDESLQSHGSKYDYSKSTYVGYMQKIKIICPKHGEFLQTPYSHRRGHGCPTCNSSKGEEKIRVFCESSNISVEFQKTFDGCRNPNTSRLLRYDFYIPDKNILIEYDGAQHFKEGIGKKIFGKHLFTEQEYLTNKHRDDVKTKWAKDNNIKLIRIPYTKYDEIDDILTKELLS